MDEGLIERLMAKLAASDLSELQLTQGPDQLVLRKGGLPAPTAATPAPAPAAPGTPPASGTVPAPAVPPTAPAEPAGPTLKAPLVGIVYLAPKPGAKPFVQVGQPVAAGDVVCIIESMKMMNEIKAETAGTISAVLVQDESLVEYDQALFSLTPDADA
ncbi:acetyl-CoA carboxylase biotin carboxyl carrier protein [Lacticaseibacillus daqingensis]|uniref:acetyl-CoA carboxylase biotin carboxyl carrier protein n=1 Tax=Lacticaseibacillus daqingensis TaxID=2486014 RepID=UPI000F770C10|nr:acetyl-CoA carboxylase biotin carboxyl carrier protein [Lacticaseibacillus daqingensis]